MTRNAPLLIGMALGAIVGMLSSLGDSTGLKIVMMAIGALAGAAIGGAVSRFGRSQPLQNDFGPNLGFSAEAHARNYWRDKGEIYPMPGHPDPEGARGEFDRAP